MKKVSAKEIIVPAVSLFIICLVVTTLLAVTNKITAPKIEQLAVETQNNTKKVVLSDAAKFSDEKTVEKDGTQYTYYEGLSDSDETVGYVFLTSAKGYGGDIDLMVGIDKTGSVKGVAILSISETAGLGMNAKNESFLNQFKDKNSEISVIKTGEAKDNEIQALTGATITSNAVTSAVNTALELYKKAGGEVNG
jgi:Na+-translocating ferredoxin:NAD+ oxidoreductase subunit G